MVEKRDGNVEKKGSKDPDLMRLKMEKMLR